MNKNLIRVYGRNANSVKAFLVLIDVLLKKNKNIIYEVCFKLLLMKYINLSI